MTWGTVATLYKQKEKTLISLTNYKHTFKMVCLNKPQKNFFKRSEEWINCRSFSDDIRKSIKVMNLYFFKPKYFCKGV